jgi:hypothetical protein
MLCGATAAPERGGNCWHSLAAIYRQNHVRADRPLFSVIDAPSQETSGVMAVIDELLAETTTAKNTALLEQLGAELDDYWRYRPKSR